MKFRALNLCVAALAMAAASVPAQAQQLGPETQQTYLSLCGISANSSFAYKFMGDPDFGVNDAAPVIAFDPKTHPDGALACIPLRSEGTNWPTGGIYIYSDGAIRGKFGATISGVRLGVTESTDAMSPSGKSDTDAAIYDSIEWSEFTVTSPGGFFGGAVAEGNGPRIMRGLEYIRDGGAIYFEFKSPNGVSPDTWRPFKVDRLGYRSRASAKALWQALNWKRGGK